jgi:hypothetical protein
LQREVEAVSVEDDDAQWLHLGDDGFDPVGGGTCRFQSVVAAVGDPRAQHRISFGHQHRDRKVRDQCVRKGKHPLQVTEAHALPAVGDQQCSGSHSALACAAQTCIRRSAVITSSWSDVVMVGYSGNVTSRSHRASARGAVPGTPPRAR